MIGSIIGDIAGSVYEFDPIRTTDFPLMGEGCDFTDDTILTAATAQWLLQGGDPAAHYARFATLYPHPMGAYGHSFSLWVERAREGRFEPYGSCGNGSAMRVGPVGWHFGTMKQTLRAAEESASCTHDHPEGIKGAQAVAAAIFLSRHGSGKEEIRNHIQENFGYDLSFTCDGIRGEYGWGALCQDTVPQAIVAFLDAGSFEESVRLAVSLGGDADTLACITGSIAEAFFPVPEELRRRAMGLLDDRLRKIVEEFERHRP